MRKLNDKREFYKILEEVLIQIFPFCNKLMTDNETIFNSIAAKALFQQLYIEHSMTAANHSTSNAQVERLHLTILEITRIRIKQNKSAATEELFNAIKEYNRTRRKPIELFFERSKTKGIKELIENKQEYMLSYHNKKRTQKEYKTGQTVYVKQNRRNKTNPRYLKKTVQENYEDTILTTEGKIVHKDNLRNNDEDNANINPSNILSSGNNRLTRSQVRVNRD